MSRLRSLTTLAFRAALLQVLVASSLDSIARADLGPGQVQYNPALNPPFAFFTPSYISAPLPSALAGSSRPNSAAAFVLRTNHFLDSFPCAGFVLKLDSVRVLGHG